MSRQQPLPQRVLRFIRGHNLVRENELLLVGVSGGPDGTVPELRDQCCAAVKDILEEQRTGVGEKCSNEDKVVVAITHFFPIMCIICDTLGLDLSYFRRFRLDVASMCTFDFNPERAVLVSFNDTCHLREGI